MKTLLSAAFVAGFAVVGSSASAAVIWEDDFNRTSSYTVGNGWTEREDRSRDVGITNADYMYLFDQRSSEPDAAAMSKTIDATHYENISVMFKWKAGYKNEAGNTTDRLHLAWDLDPASSLSSVETNAWTQAGSVTSGNSNWYTSTFNLASAADMSIFNIAFWTRVNRDDEGFYIDWVQVKGDYVNKPTPVPLPASGLMLLAGAGALAATRRRKRC